MNAKETHEHTKQAMVQSAMDTVKGICEEIQKAANECRFSCEVRLPSWMKKDKEVVEGVMKALRELGYHVTDLTLENDSSPFLTISWSNPS